MTLRENIQAIALDRKIPFLVHFTRVDNIPSIMQHGLVPMTVAKEIGIYPVINDQLRLDGRLNGTSVSISFPNGQMFYRLRMENPSISWAVLAISTSVLWSKDVLFCRHIAADARVSKVSSDTLRQSETFSSLFEEIEDFQSRSEQGIKDYDPTDVQAEALVMEKIEPEFIIGALFNDKKTLDQYRVNFGKRKLILHQGRKGFFANRTYYRKFGGG